jgi:aspartokinase-like uncharacterized kinase
MRRIVKLGGSLLEFDHVVDHLHRWLNRSSDDSQLLVVGGGRLADVIRDADQRFKLGEEAAHRLAIRTMCVNARLLKTLLPDVPILPANKAQQYLGEAIGRLAILDSNSLLNPDVASPIASLPASWDATSDSIAAHIAIEWRADELVLLKSRLPEAGACDWASLAAAGYVDRHLTRLADRLPAVRLVDLRNRDFSEVILNAGPSSPVAPRSNA